MTVGSMNGGPVFSWQNAAGLESAGTVNVACAEAAPGSEIKLLRHPWPYLRFVTQSTAEVVIDVDFGADRPALDAVALRLPQAPPDAVAEVTLYSGLFTGPLGTLGPTPAAPAGDPGVPCWAEAVLAPSGTLVPLTARSVRLTLRSANRHEWHLANLYLATGSHRLAHAPAWPPTYEAVADVRTWEPLSARLGFDLPGLPATDWAALHRLLRATAPDRPLLWLTDPDHRLAFLPTPFRGLFTVEPLTTTLRPGFDPEWELTQLHLTSW